MKMWCEDCKEVYDVEPQKDYMFIDGRPYEFFEFYECPVNDNHTLVEVRNCPICGEPMGEYDEYCPACKDTTNQALTELRDYLHASQSDFEDLVQNVMGW